MKHVFLFCAFLALALATQEERRILLKDIFSKPTILTEYQLSAKINTYIDKVFENLQHFFTDNGFDPLSIQDVHEEFEHKIFFITYHGELNLTKGSLHELRSIQRDGDAILKYDTLLLHVEVPMTFKTLLFNYDYSVMFMSTVGLKGGLGGKVKDVKMSMNVMLDLKDIKIYIKHFELPKVGEISVKLTGHGMVDWFANILSGIATRVLHGRIVNILEDKVSVAMQQIAAQINDDLKNTFG